MCIYNIYTNLPATVRVRLPHRGSRDIQGQETFLAPSADKQTRNHDARKYTMKIYIYNLIK